MNSLNNNPLVTIITPTFNLIKNGRKDWFIQNMESVQNQTYKNVEHIVIDGASEDGTIELLKEYQKKGWIKYYSEPDGGIYDAMNKGILKAKGKYVVCLNSDDFYCDTQAVEWLVEKAEENDADACCGSAYSVKPKKMSSKNYWSCYQNNNLIFGEMACHQTFLIKTSVMKDLGLYDLEYKISADTGFMYKLVNNNKKICMIDKVIITYRLGGASSGEGLVDADVCQSLFNNYGKYHFLTKSDCESLIGNKFLEMSLDKAIQLGSKLEKKEWIEEYFRRLFKKYLTISSRDLFFENNVLSKINVKYKVFSCIPFLKIQKDVNKMKILLFGILPLIKIKQKGSRKTWSVLGVPIFKIRNIRSGQIRIYYIFNIPVLKVSKKGY